MDDPRVKALSEIFVHTLSTNPAVIKQAEVQLQVHTRQPGFGIAVLKLVATEMPEEHRLAPAVNFKNFVKANWAAKDDVAAVLISEPEKEQIKGLLTTLMLSAPSRVRAQLSEALVIIGAHDFPARWPNLLPELVERLQTGDLSTIHGVLETANSIYKRYRSQVMTNALSKELEYSQVIVNPLLQTLKKLSAQLPAAASSPDAMRQLLLSVRLVMRIFFSLNSPGLTETFEELLPQWMEEFKLYLTLAVPTLAESDPEKESPVDAVKAAVCDNIVLFMELNEEEFMPFLPAFAQDVWMQLVEVTDRPGQDHLAMSAIHFLTSIAKSSQYMLFDSVLEQVCDKIVVPNIMMRSDLEDMFNNNFMEYIQRDTEGSDSDTRRRAATELVKALTAKFPDKVAALFKGYVNRMLQEYKANPEANWKAKDCAIYLVSAFTLRGKTATKGATATNEFVNLHDFFRRDIENEIMDPKTDKFPVIKADALKFLSTFRSQIPKHEIVMLMPQLTLLLTAESNVVHSYAAICIERLLSMKEDGQPVFSRIDVQPVLVTLLNNLFQAFNLAESEENQYLMKCVMRVIVFVGPELAIVAGICLQQLAGLLLSVADNPRQPYFAYYLFESIAATIKQCSPVEAERHLFVAFNIILQQDVQEFHPYVFQIFSQLIEEREAPLPDIYMTIFPPLLTQFYWERKGNIPALVRLLQAYLNTDGPQLVEAGHLENMLGVFQRLVATKAHDHEGFFILNALLESLPTAIISPYLPPLWRLLFDRLQNSRTPKFVRSFVVFLALFMCKHGVAFVADSVDAVQPGLFIGGILQQVWLPNMAAATGAHESKLIAVASAKVLCEWRGIQNPQNAVLWGQLLDTLLRYLEAGPPQTDTAEEDEEEERAEVGYSAGYARLNNAAKEDPDPLPEVPNANQYLANALSQLSQSQPGMLTQLLQAGNVPLDMQQRLQAYCAVAGVTIA